jgi:hypothetical protein
MKQIECPAQNKPDALKCELAGEVLRSFGRLRMGVTGWSMMPTLWPGDTLLIEKVGYNEVGRGDLVLFARHRRLFVHRLIGKTGSGTDGVIFTQGDSMPYEDEAVKSSELVGRVSWILRRGKGHQPRTKLRFVELMLSGLLRRFRSVGRVFAEIHELSKPEQILPCQN